MLKKNEEKVAVRESLRLWVFENAHVDCIHIYSFQAMSLRIVTGKKHCQIKLQHLQKVGIWAFGLLVHQTSSL